MQPDTFAPFFARCLYKLTAILLAKMPVSMMKQVSASDLKWLIFAKQRTSLNVQHARIEIARSVFLDLEKSLIWSTGAARRAFNFDLEF